MDQDDPTKPDGYEPDPDDVAALTSAKQQAFLEALARVGTITAAAQAANVSRDTHYEWMKRDPATPVEANGYELAFQNARDQFRDRLRHEAIQRSLQGVRQRVMYQGAQCTEPLIDADGKPVLDEDGEPKMVLMWEYVKSDRLLERLLDANCEEFTRKLELTGEGGGPVRVMAVRYPLRIEDKDAWSKQFNTSSKAPMESEDDE
jgi:hypothetical protein